MNRSKYTSRNWEHEQEQGLPRPDGLFRRRRKYTTEGRGRAADHGRCLAVPRHFKEGAGSLKY